MTSPEKPFSAPESLRLIQDMIQAAKQNLSDNSFDLLLWGWLVLAAALIHYGLLQTDYDKPWLAWPVLMGLGTVVAFVNGFRRKRREKSSTVQGDFLTFLWVGYGVLLLMLIGAGAAQGWQRIYPLIIGLYGLGTFATGGALRFRLLVWGGAGCWLLATAAFRVGFEAQLLLVAAAVLVAYIVPGHLLCQQYRRDRAV